MFKLKISPSLEQKSWFLSGCYFSVYVIKQGGSYLGDMKFVFLSLMKMRTTTNPSKN